MSREWDDEQQCFIWVDDREDQDGRLDSLANAEAMNASCDWD